MGNQACLGAVSNSEPNPGAKTLSKPLRIKEINKSSKPDFAAEFPELPTIHDEIVIPKVSQCREIHHNYLIASSPNKYTSQIGINNSPEVDNQQSSIQNINKKELANKNDRKDGTNGSNKNHGTNNENNHQANNQSHCNSLVKNEKKRKHNGDSNYSGHLQQNDFSECLKNKQCDRDIVSKIRNERSDFVKKAKTKSTKKSEKYIVQKYKSLSKDENSTNLISIQNQNDTKESQSPKNERIKITCESLPPSEQSLDEIPLLSIDKKRLCDYELSGRRNSSNIMVPTNEIQNIKNLTSITEFENTNFSRLQIIEEVLSNGNSSARLKHNGSQAKRRSFQGSLNSLKLKPVIFGQVNSKENHPHSSRKNCDPPCSERSNISSTSISLPKQNQINVVNTKAFDVYNDIRLAATNDTKNELLAISKAKFQSSKTKVRTISPVLECPQENDQSPTCVQKVDEFAISKQKYIELEKNSIIYRKKTLRKYSTPTDSLRKVILAKALQKNTELKNSNEELKSSENITKKRKNEHMIEYVDQSPGSLAQRLNLTPILEGKARFVTPFRFSKNHKRAQSQGPFQSKLLDQEKTKQKACEENLQSKYAGYFKKFNLPKK